MAEKAVTFNMLKSEAIGTALLVFIGIGSVVTATGGASYVHHKGQEDETSYFILGFNNQGQSIPTNTVHVALSFGLVVTAIAYATGHISGAHLNPAVSFGLMAAGRINLIQAIQYSIAQIFGAAVGSALLKFATMGVVSMKDDTFHAGSTYNPDTDFTNWNLGASLLAPGVGLLTGVIIETILTFMLVYVVIGCTSNANVNNQSFAPLAIGFAVFACHGAGILLSGSSVNPARSIGPAIFSPAEGVWVELPGPMLGGFLAGKIAD